MTITSLSACFVTVKVAEEGGRKTRWEGWVYFHFGETTSMAGLQRAPSVKKSGPPVKVAGDKVLV